MIASKENVREVNPARLALFEKSAGAQNFNRPNISQGMYATLGGISVGFLWESHPMDLWDISVTVSVAGSIRGS